MDEAEPQAPSWGLVMVRLATGAILALAGWQKILAGADAQFVLDTQERVAAGPAWFASFMDVVVYRFPEATAQLIQWGELVGGVALFLGALTRPVGVFAALMLVCFSFAGPQEQIQFQLLLALCALACAISRAGRRVGLDALFDGHFPGWVTWTRA